MNPNRKTRIRPLPRAKKFSKAKGWGLVAIVALTAIALFLALGATFRGVRQAKEALDRGLAQQLQSQVRSDLLELGKLPTEEELLAIVDEYASSGLKGIAILPKKSPAILAGPAFPSLPLNRKTLKNLSAGQLYHQENGRIRVRLPNLLRRFRRVPQNGGAQKRPRPLILIEFSATQSERLLQSSRRSLAFGALASILLLFLSGYLAVKISRRDKEREKEAHEKRLQSLGEMSTVLAHEIRNPLASLKGNAQILQQLIPMESASQEKIQNKADRVVMESIRLEDLVNDLLNFAKSGQLKKSPVDPAQLLRDCAKKHSENISIDTANCPSQWNLDAARMHQVLDNLLSNAVHASENVEAKVSQIDKNLVFSIRDHGAGIAGDPEKLFEAFHTQKTQGTGLGLAVAKRLVELHGGTIEAQNWQQGAEFNVSIPED